MEALQSQRETSSVICRPKFLVADDDKGCLHEKYILKTKLKLACDFV